MFDRFTDRARRIMGLARAEAQKWNHDYIGTEHMLLGLLADDSGVAISVIRKLGVSPDDIRASIGSMLAPGQAMVTMGQLPFTPRAKKILDLALQEAAGMGVTYIGSEHLLLGMILEREGTAALSLRAFNVDYDRAKAEAITILCSGPTPVTARNDSPWKSPVLDGAPSEPGHYWIASFAKSSECEVWMGRVRIVHDEKSRRVEVEMMPGDWGLFPPEWQYSGPMIRPPAPSSVSLKR